MFQERLLRVRFLDAGLDRGARDGRFGVEEGVYFGADLVAGVVDGDARGWGVGVGVRV